MNATETAILTAITDIACHDVKTIAAEIGKSDTTVRKGLKALEAANKIYRDGNSWYSIVEAETPAETTDQPAEVESTDVEPEAVSDDAEDAEPEDKPTRKYQRHETPTTRTVRTNQITGAEVQVLRAGETSKNGAVMGQSHKWFAVCITHNDLGGFDKVLDAHFASSYPTFCPTCASKMTSEQIGRRRRGSKA